MNTVHFSDIFCALAESHPQRVAIEARNLSLTFRQLISWSSAYSQQLQMKGIQKGDRVGIVLRDNPHALVALIALWMIDAVPVPFDFRTKNERLSTLAQAFGIRFMVRDNHSGNSEHFVMIPFEASWISDEDEYVEPPALTHDESVPALVVLTSGTTGSPKGIVIDHDRLLFRVLHPLKIGELDTSGKLLNPILLSFPLAIHNVIGHLVRGGTVVMFPVIYSTAELAEAIIQKDITSVCLVPTLVRNLLDFFPNQKRPAFPNLRMMYCSGAPLAESDKLAAREILTENFLELFANSVSGRISMLEFDDMADHSDTVGRVLPEVRIQIVDKNLNPLPTGQVGLIRVRGPGMAREIIVDAESARTGDNIENGWIYTGDLGSLNDQRFLKLAGRDSEVIIRNGENIYPAEIENVIIKIQGVKAAAVIGYQSGREDEKIAAFVVSDKNITEQDIFLAFRSSVVPNKHPNKIIFLEELPQNQNGKINKIALAEFI